jgi:hypothetical protein
VISQMMSNTLKDKSVPTTSSTERVGCNRGHVMREKRFQAPAPSIRAASLCSLGTPSSIVIKTTACPPTT